MSSYLEKLVMRRKIAESFFSVANGTSQERLGD